MKKAIRIGLRILGGMILIVLLIVLLLTLFIQTRPAKKMITRIAEKQVSQIINGDLSVGELDGNFFAHLLLKDVLLTSEEDTLAFVQEIELKYNLLSLFDGLVDLHSVDIVKPYVYLEQRNDSTWNLQELMKPAEEEADTTSTGSVNINLSIMNINNGRIVINAPDSIIPDAVHNLNAEISLFYSDSLTHVDLSKFNFLTANPHLQLKQLSVLFKMDQKQAELERFHLETAQNRIEGTARYTMAPSGNGTAQFITAPLNTDEFAFLIPGTRLPANPVLTFNGQMQNDTIEADLVLKDKDQTLTARILSGNLMDFIAGDTTIILDYRLTTQLDNIQPAYWTGIPTIDYILNGTFNIRGYGIDPATANVSMQANLEESTIEDQAFNNLQADLILNNGNLNGNLQGMGGFGSFYLEPILSDLMGNPKYNVLVRTEGLNVGALTGNDTLTSDINMKAKLEGSSFEPEKIAAQGDLLVYRSSFQDWKIDTLSANLVYAKENLDIRSFWLQTQSVTAEATGNYSMKGASDIRLQVRFDNLSEIEHLLPEMELSTKGEMEAHMSGIPDSLMLEAALRLDSTAYDTMTFSNMELLVNGQLTQTDTLFDASVVIHSLDLGGFLLDTVRADANGSTDSVFVDAYVANEDMNTHLQAGIVPGAKLAVTLPGWDINYKNQSWSLREPPAYIEIDSVDYLIDNFRLASGDGDTTQYLAANGLLSRRGDEDFTFEAINIQISELFELMQTDAPGSGAIDMKLNVTGNSEAPRIEGSLDVRDATFNEYNFTTLESRINFDENILSFSSLIVPQDSGRFEMNAKVPMQLNLDTMGFHFSPEDTIQGRLTIRDFSLGILNSFDIPVQTTGFIEGNVDVGGTVSEPDPEGSIRLVDASFRMPEFGVDYRDVRLNLSFMRDRIELDTFRINTSDGDLRGSGRVNFGSEIYKGDISTSKVELNFNGFNPVDHPQFNLQVEGHAELTGEADSLRFDGDLKIPRAEFYLPAIFQLMGKFDEKEIPKPILVRELEMMTASLDSTETIVVQEEEPDSAGFDYLDQLKGQMRVRIPRNTWIKNDDMRLEISGELELLKNAEFFELFGQVDVVRGQYAILGRTFVIDEGTVNFEGGEDMNIKMDINASYTFRNNKQVQQVLSVNILGTMEEPEVNFELDGSVIDEGDALSYILFGKSMDELTLNEQDNMESAGVGSLAQQAAASLISAQLTNFLQNKLNVDYIEVKTGGSFDEASVVVGKYITNNLFVSYEQKFGQTDELNPKKYEVKLEYELFRFLFFELNNSTIDSGFNVIFKFDVL